MNPVTRPFAGQLSGTIRTAVLIAGIVTLTACGTQSEDGPDSSPTGTSSAATSPSQASAGAGRASSPQDERVHALTLSAQDLPEGWRNSSQPDPSFRMTICGVDIEPTGPLAEDRLRFSQTGIGPFLYEYVRVYEDTAQAADVAKALAAAFPTCPTTTFPNSAGDQLSFTIEQLQVADLPSGAVAWRMFQTGGQGPIQDCVLLPAGDALVFLQSVAVSGDPDAEVLSTAVREVVARS